MSVASQVGRAVVSQVASSAAGVSEGGAAAPSFALVVSTSASNATSSAVNTTGAKLLVAVGSAFGGASTFTDSKSNTWIALTAPNSGSYTLDLAYCIDPVVGTGHTFSFGGGFNAFRVFAFSATGTVAYGGMDSDATSLSVTDFSPGSITPDLPNSLIIAGATTGATTADVAVSGSMALAQYPSVGGVNVGEASAYLLQSVAALFTPTFTFPSSQVAATVAFFTVS